MSVTCIATEAAQGLSLNLVLTRLLCRNMGTLQISDQLTQKLSLSSIAGLQNCRPGVAAPLEPPVMALGGATVVLNIHLYTEWAKN